MEMIGNVRLALNCNLVFLFSYSLSIFKRVLVSPFLATGKLGPLVFLFFFQLAKEKKGKVLLVFDV